MKFGFDLFQVLLDDIHFYILLCCAWANTKSKKDMAGTAEVGTSYGNRLWFFPGVVWCIIGEDIHFYILLCCASANTKSISFFILKSFSSLQGICLLFDHRWFSWFAVATNLVLAFFQSVEWNMVFFLFSILCH